MKILFLLPPKLDVPLRDVGTMLISPNIGTAYMAAYLLKHGHEATIADAEPEQLSTKDIENIIRVRKPGIVGLSAMTDRIHDAAAMADLVKKIDPSIKTVVGGAHASALPGQTLDEFPPFDFAVHGEGEETLMELIGTLETGGDMAGVPGLAWRGDGKSFVNQARPRIQDLDSLPFPSFDLYRLERYHAFYTRDNNVRELPVSTTRGCPFNCVFCSTVMGKRLVFRSTDNVIEEIRHGHNKFGATQFVMTDESFTFNLKRTEEFCEKFINEGLNKKINWIVHSRVEVTKEILLKMREANCSHITFGIESGAQEILDKNFKQITLEKSINAVRWAREAGLITDGNFILGMPYDTLKTMKATIRFAIRCKVHYASLSLFVPYPGTESMRLALAGEANLRLLSTDWRNYGKQIGGAVEMKDFSRKQLERLQFIGYLRFYLRPGKMILVFNKINFRTVLEYLKNIFMPKKTFA